MLELIPNTIPVPFPYKKFREPNETLETKEFFTSMAANDWAKLSQTSAPAQGQKILNEPKFELEPTRQVIYYLFKFRKLYGLI